jgi:hypothetical protein
MPIVLSITQNDKAAFEHFRLFCGFVWPWLLRTVSETLPFDSFAQIGGEPA